jgi:DNA polymerase-3 subunit delta'
VHGLFRKLVAQGDADFALRGALSGAMGQRPDRERQLAAIECARMVLVDICAMGTTIPASASPMPMPRWSALPGRRRPNFDPALLMMEIGGLLASVARTREGAH